MTKCKLRPVALGLALGSLWALSILLIAVLAYLGYEGGLMSMLHKMHSGYEDTIAGVLVAAVFALIDGFIHGALIGYLYNVFANCCCKKSGKCD